MATTWGASVRQMRKDAGLSLRAVAERANVSFPYLSRVERGEFPPPSTWAIRRIASALGANADELIAQAGKVDQHYSQRLRGEIASLEAVFAVAAEAFIAYENTQERIPGAGDSLHDAMGRLGLALYEHNHGRRAATTQEAP